MKNCFRKTIACILSLIMLASSANIVMADTLANEEIISSDGTETVDGTEISDETTDSEEEITDNSFDEETTDNSEDAVESDSSEDESAGVSLDSSASSDEEKAAEETDSKASEDENISNTDEINDAEDTVEENSSYANNSGANVVSLNNDEPGISVMSLFPLSKVSANVDLTDFLPVELENIKVSYIFENMTFPNEDTPEELKSIPDDAITVWRYNEREDDLRKKAMTDTVNLNELKRNDDGTIEVILESGNQLDAQNVKYELTITKPENFYYQYSFYEQADDGTRTKIDENSIEDIVSSQDKDTGKDEDEDLDEDEENDNALSISSQISSMHSIEGNYFMSLSVVNPNAEKTYSENLAVKAYEGKYDSAEQARASGKEITSQIINVSDMEIASAGYKIACKNSAEEISQDITLVFERKGEPFNVVNIPVTLYRSSLSESWGMYFYDVNNADALIGKVTKSNPQNYCTIHQMYESDEDDEDVEHNYVKCYTCSASELFNKDDEYLLKFTMSANVEKGEISANIYDGYYTTVEEAAASNKEITQAVLNDGFKYPKNDGISFFTIVYRSNTGKFLDIENAGITFNFNSLNTSTCYLFDDISASSLASAYPSAIGESGESSIRKPKQLKFGIKESKYYNDKEYYLGINCSKSDVVAKVYDGTYKTEDEIKTAKLLTAEQLTAEQLPSNTTAVYKAKWAESENGKAITLVYERNGKIISIENLTVVVAINDNDVYSKVSLLNANGDTVKSEYVREANAEVNFTVSKSSYDESADYYLSIVKNTSLNENITVSAYDGLYNTAEELSNVQKLNMEPIAESSSLGYKIKLSDFENGKVVTLAYEREGKIIKIESFTLTITIYDDFSFGYLSLYDQNSISSTYPHSLATSDIRSDGETNKVQFTVKKSVYDKNAEYYVTVNSGKAPADAELNVYDGTITSPEEISSASKLNTEKLSDYSDYKVSKINASELETGKAITLTYEKDGKVIKIENVTLLVNMEDDLYITGYHLYDSEGDWSSYAEYAPIFTVPNVKYGKDYDYYLSLSLSNSLSNSSSIIDASVYEGTYTNAEELSAAQELPFVSDDSVFVSGYKAKWAESEEGKAITLAFKRNNEIIDIENLTVILKRNESGSVSPNYFLKSVNSKIAATKDKDAPESGKDSILKEINYTLSDGFLENDEYYFSMNYTGNIYDKWETSVTKAVIGLYDSLETASESEDIKDDLFGAGYKANYSDGVEFTIFYDNKVARYRVKVQESEYNYADDEMASESDIEKYFDYNLLIPGASADRFFDVKALRKDSGLPGGYEALDAYRLPYEHDNYNGYGYQTLFVNDVNADLSNIIPFVSISKYVTVYNNGVQLETDKDRQSQNLPAQDFTNRSAEYQVVAENHIGQRNYYVSVVKKENGPKLFVNGPDKREIMMGLSKDDFGYKDYHDIFIANIGDEPLTNIKVTLKNAQNVKLDDYWTIGGAGNDTLAAFDETSHKEIGADGSENEVDGLYNIGKIRLVPDGDGLVSGTLVIEADDGNGGKQTKTIELVPPESPKIITDEALEGTQYVLYSSIISTNNMYDAMGNEVTFDRRPVRGRLPEGLALYPSGEIYGVPKESGTFRFVAKANNSYNGFVSDEKEITITIKDNSDENVKAEEEKDPDSAIITYLGDSNRTFDVSSGEVDENLVLEFEYPYLGNEDKFVGVWIDGERIEDMDYIIEDGSSKITLASQTITNQYNGTHTITTGYHDKKESTIKKTAQNFKVKGGVDRPSNNGSGGGSGSSGGSGGGGGGSSSKKSSSTYTVSFDSNGGSDTAASKVVKNSKMSWLATPSKPGYEFAGWYTDAELTKPFDKDSTTVTKDMKLYAKWQPIKCTIWFNSNGGTSVDSIEAQGDTTVSNIPVPTRENYKFAGWYTDEALTNPFDENAKIVSNMTLYAKWDLIIPDEAPESAKGFSDIDENAWYYSDVDWAYSKNLMVGYNNAVFAPKDAISASNIVTVLAKLSNDDLSQYNNSAAVGNIQENVWYTPYAKWASNANIIDAAQFNSDSKISREDIAVMLVKFLDYSKAEYNVSSDDIDFADSSAISDNAKDAVKTLFKLGILAGRGNNVIDPKSSITRAEFAALLHRMEKLG